MLSDCTVIICDYCEKVDHVSDVCPLLTVPKPQIVVYGHAHDSLMFFEMVCTNSYRPNTENTRYGVVTVVGGDMTPPQVIRQLQRLVPVEQYQWEVTQVGQNVFKVLFPSKAELDRLKVFGTFKVPNSSCELTADYWASSTEPTEELPQVWIRMKGIPPREKGDFVALWGLGTPAYPRCPGPG